MRNTPSPQRTLLRAGAVSLASSVLFLAGCALTQTASEDNSVASGATISGKAYGGQQPIGGATVTLYAAGNAGYGSPATALATAVTNSAGVFSFHPATGVATYTCPSLTSTTESQYLYIVVSGGQPVPGTPNPVEAEMIALGNCATVLATNPQVIVDEATTIAAMTAMQQFFSPLAAGLGNFGASSTNITGLANAMATANVLVNPSTGGSAVSTASGPVVGFTANPAVTITPEIAKIDTEADILASCINSDPTSSTTCQTLFNEVSALPATDTLQAAYYMASNPTSTIGSTSNLAAIYGLVGSNPPFQPTLTAAPTDWTIGVTYGSSSASIAGTYLLNSPAYLAVDGSGNVWAVNSASSSSTSTANSVTELSPTGTPKAQVLTGAGVLAGPSGIAIDPTGNVWVPNFGSSASPASSVAEYTALGLSNTFKTNQGPQSLAIDGKGDVLVLEPSASGSGDLEEIAAGALTGGTATTLATGLTTGLSNLAIDSKYTVWVTGGGQGSMGGVTGYPALYQFLYSSTSPNYPATPSATTVAGGVSNPQTAIAIDGGNNVYVQNYGAETLAELSGSTTILGASGAPIKESANLTKPQFQAIDGAGNPWVTDSATTSSNPAGSVFEIALSGAPAPATGFSHTYNQPYGIALDASGNVWVGAHAGSSITEIVGAAVPVVTPLAAGLPTTPGGASKLATRP